MERNFIFDASSRTAFYWTGRSRLDLSREHVFNLTRNMNINMIMTDTTRSHTTIPRTIQWHEINLPDKWKLEVAIDPMAPTPIRNTSLSEISQHQDGTIELKFNRPQIMPPRNSFEIGSTNTAFRRLNIEEESNPETQTVDFRTARASVSSIPTTFKTNLQGTDNSSNIAQPIYARQEESSQNSPNMSPTYSSMTNN
ncbi:hypothetical protein Gotri_025303, partial [Gossypium trilobum]|nr:hypothetical protein [Gossypium trilobum]